MQKKERDKDREEKAERQQREMQGDKGQNIRWDNVCLTEIEKEENSETERDRMRQKDRKIEGLSQRDREQTRQHSVGHRLRQKSRQTVEAAAPHSL